MKGKKSRKPGFTLIEMLVTLGIFALIMGMAMPLIMRSARASHVQELKAEMGAALYELELYVAGKEAGTFSTEITTCGLGRIQMYQSPYLEDDSELALDLPKVLSALPDYLAYEVGVESFGGSDRFVISVSYPAHNSDFRGITPEEISGANWPETGQLTEWIDRDGINWQAYNADQWQIPGGSLINITTIKATTYFYEINSGHNHSTVSYTLR